MTRKRLGAIDKASISIMRNVAEKTAAERREFAGAKAPPIGQVAGAAARSVEEEILRLRQERDGLQEDAAAWAEANATGLVLIRIPLDQIDDHALARDRRGVDRSSEAWTELRDSLQARGQQTPIEVIPGDDGQYGLVSGFRRLSALRDLWAETGDESFATVKALVADRPATMDAMIAMVEENEIRQDVSFYERGRICCLAAEQGICTSVDEAIHKLFANSSRNRRYKIRNFTLIHAMIGSYLDYPEAIGERLGARIAQALKDGRAPRLIAVLADRGEKFADAAAELAVLEAFVGQKGVFGDRKLTERPAPMTAGRDAGLWRAQATAKQGRVTVELKGIDVTDIDELQDLVDRVVQALDTA